MAWVARAWRGYDAGLACDPWNSHSHTRPRSVPVPIPIPSRMNLPGGLGDSRKPAKGTQTCPNGAAGAAKEEIDCGATGVAKVKIAAAPWEPQMRNQRFRVGGTQRVDLVRWVHEGSPLATRYPSSRDATVGTARMPPFLRSCP
eukprot:gene3602-biopygen9779